VEHNKIEKCFLRECDGSYTEIAYSDLLRLEEHDSSFRGRFFLTLEGGLLEVTEDAYRHFNRAERRERYLQEEAKRAGGVLSMDAEVCSLHELLADVDVCVEQTAVDALMLEQLHDALSCLPDNDLALIQVLYFEGKSERRLAEETDIPRKTINNRRRRILGKLKKLLES